MCFPENVNHIWWLFRVKQWCHGKNDGEKCKSVLRDVSEWGWRPQSWIRKETVARRWETKSVHFGKEISTNQYTLEKKLKPSIAWSQVGFSLHLRRRWLGCAGIRAKNSGTIWERKASNDSAFRKRERIYHYVHRFWRKPEMGKHLFGLVQDEEKEHDQ